MSLTHVPYASCGLVHRLQWTPGQQQTLAGRGSCLLGRPAGSDGILECRRQSD